MEAVPIYKQTAPTVEPVERSVMQERCVLLEVVSSPVKVDSLIVAVTVSTSGRIEPTVVAVVNLANQVKSVPMVLVCSLAKLVF